MTPTSLAANNLLRRPARTTLSILGVGVGIGTLVAFVSLARGFREQFTRIVTGTGAELVVQQRGSIAPEHSAITDEDLAVLRAIPSAAEVAPSTFTLVRRGVLPFPVLGREPGSRLLQMHRIVEGRSIERGQDDELIISKGIATTHALRVGDTVTLRDRPFRIVGRFESKAPVPLLNQGAIGSIAAVQSIMRGDRRIHMVFVYVDDPRRTDAVLQAIRAARPGLEAWRASEYIEEGFRDQLDTAERFAWAISSLALIVAAIVVALVMLTNVTERTREIGTLRALGWTRVSIIGLILREGVMLCLLGAGLGCLLGAAGAELFARGWRYGFFYAHLTPALLLEALAVAAALGLAGTIYPAWRSSGMAPVDALRYE
jgi:putative ABC transport system permease protein